MGGVGLHPNDRFASIVDDPGVFDYAESHELFVPIGRSPLQLLGSKKAMAKNFHPS